MVAGAATRRRPAVEIPKTFGELLRELRTKPCGGASCEYCTMDEPELCGGVSQGTLARRSGVSPGYIGLIETGQRGKNPSREIIKRLSGALKCTVEELEMLMRVAGHLGPNERLIDEERVTVLAAIEADPVLVKEDKVMLISMYERMTSKKSKPATAKVARKRS